MYGHCCWGILKYWNGGRGTREQSNTRQKTRSKSTGLQHLKADGTCKKQIFHSQCSRSEKRLSVAQCWSPGAIITGTTYIWRAQLVKYFHSLFTKKKKNWVWEYYRVEDDGDQRLWEHVTCPKSWMGYGRAWSGPQSSFHMLLTGSAYLHQQIWKGLHTHRVPCTMIKL